MKCWRATFLSLMLVWLLAGLISGQRVFFVLFFLHLLMLGSAVIVNVWAAFSYAYTQKPSDERTIRGRPVNLHLEVHNEKPIPFPMMTVHLATADPLNPQKLDFNLGANDHLSFDLTLDCPHRGEYTIGMTVIDFVDLFGLIRLPFDMRLLPYYREKRLLVYPRLVEVEIPALLSSGSRIPDGRRAATDNPQDPFSMVRNYQAGDSRKMIHWKLSSRQQSLLTRQFDHLNEPRVLVLLDLRHPSGSTRESLLAIDACCEATAAICRAILKRGWPVRLVSFNEARNSLAADSLSAFDPIHNWLARVAFSGVRPFPELLAAELAAASNIRAVMAITHDAASGLLPVLLNAQHKSVPVQGFFTGQAALDSYFVSGVRQTGVPALFFRSVQDLADKMRAAL